jgi:hypothetical protein
MPARRRVPGNAGTPTRDPRALIDDDITDDLLGHARIAESQQRLPVQAIGVAVIDVRVQIPACAAMSTREVCLTGSQHGKLRTLGGIAVSTISHQGPEQLPGRYHAQDHERVLRPPVPAAPAWTARSGRICPARQPRDGTDPGGSAGAGDPLNRRPAVLRPRAALLQERPDGGRAGTAVTRGHRHWPVSGVVS